MKYPILDQASRPPENKTFHLISTVYRRTRLLISGCTSRNVRVFIMPWAYDWWATKKKLFSCTFYFKEDLWVQPIFQQRIMQTANRNFVAELRYISEVIDSDARYSWWTGIIAGLRSEIRLKRVLHSSGRFRIVEVRLPHLIFIFQFQRKLQE